MRYVNIMVIFAVLAAVVATYGFKHDSRRVEQTIAELKRVIEDEHEAIAVLRAEWSYLIRPARLERLARERLGLVPLQPDQIRSAAVLASGGDLALPEIEEKPAVAEPSLESETPVQ